MQTLALTDDQYCVAASLRKQSGQLREQWLAYKQHDPRFFKQMEKEELKRYRAFDYVIKMQECGSCNKPPKELTNYVIRALGEIEHNDLQKQQ